MGEHGGASQAEPVQECAYVQKPVSARVPACVCVLGAVVSGVM